MCVCIWEFVRLRLSLWNLNSSVPTDFSKLFDVALVAYSEWRKCYTAESINTHTRLWANFHLSQWSIFDSVVWFLLIFHSVFRCSGTVFQAFPTHLKLKVSERSETRFAMNLLHQGLSDAIYKIVFFRCVRVPVVGLILFYRPKLFKNSGLKEVEKNTKLQLPHTHSDTYPPRDRYPLPKLIQATTYQIILTLSSCSVVTNVAHPENRDATLR